LIRRSRMPSTIAMVCEGGPEGSYTDEALGLAARLGDGESDLGTLSRTGSVG